MSYIYINAPTLFERKDGVLARSFWLEGAKKCFFIITSIHAWNMHFYHKTNGGYENFPLAPPRQSPPLPFTLSTWKTLMMMKSSCRRKKLQKKLLKLLCWKVRIAEVFEDWKKVSTLKCLQMKNFQTFSSSRRKTQKGFSSCTFCTLRRKSSQRII